MLAARHMTKSPPARLSLIGTAWPIFVEQTLRVLIGTVDTFMVSHVSDGAVAALGVANQVIVLFMLAFNFIGIGTASSSPTTWGRGTGRAPTGSRRTRSR